MHETIYKNVDDAGILRIAYRPRKGTYDLTFKQANRIIVERRDITQLDYERAVINAERNGYSMSMYA